MTPSVPQPRRPAMFSVRTAMCALAIGVGACATTPRASRDDSRVMPADQLPEDLRRTLEVYRAGGVGWEVERERVLSDPPRLRFLIDNLVVEMVRSYERSRLTSSGQVTGPFERAQRELVALQVGSTPVLVELLGVKDGIVSFLAADVLKRIGGPAVAGVTGKLAHPTRDVRRRAAELLGVLPHVDVGEVESHEALARCVRDDPEWIVRAQAARSLGARGARHDHKGYCMSVLARALVDPDPAVIESACRGLADLGERRAIPSLIQCLERAAQTGDLKGLRGAQDALRRLSGIERDLDPGGWSRWWQSERAPEREPTTSGGH